MHLDEPRIGQQRASGGDCRIEALGVAHRQQRARAGRRRDQVVRFGDRAGHGLLDQHRDPATEKRQRHLVVQFGGNGKRDGIHAAEHVTIVRVSACAGCGGDFVGARPVGIDHRDELHAWQG